jgi:hypothetical protein
VGAIGLLSWFIVQRYFIDILRWSCFIDVLGVGVRLKVIKDGLLASSPALFYCALNLYIFYRITKNLH